MNNKTTTNEYKVIKEVKHNNNINICFGFDNYTYEQNNERIINEESRNE